ncbi:YcaO-like family protein [Streptosporangium carneum]|uniref:YcaO-like family protein n=1 Tax=Streptosporangium carneum TaxID=47481 RepID=UPI0022F2AAA3|nr:YcaO-like family protein [Streptosporangium carneum]
MSLAEAATRVTAALAELGLEPKLADLGRGEDPTAWSCQMLAQDGATPPMARGMGKGRREEARVGALFEALEHYLTGPALFDPAAVELVEAGRIATGPLKDEACALTLARTSAQRLACHRYRPAGGGAKTPVPLALSAPWYVETHAGRLRERVADTYDYGELMRYSCNSGSAVGVTAAEALLHALNEIVERDAFSLLLVRAFLGVDDFRPTVIDPGTLPGDLAHAHSAAERLTGSPVHLLDITSDLEVPTALAYVAPTPGKPHRRGAGASLSLTRAVWRALTELLQSVLGEGLLSSDAPVHGGLAGLAGHPALYACGRFDLTARLRDTVTIPFEQPARPPVHPRVQLRELITLLAAHGHTPYWRVAAALPGEIVALHAVVPGLERFMLVTDGNLVLPGSRGRAAARRHGPGAVSPG